MGGKITVIVIAVAGAIGLIWLFSAVSKNNAVARASTPGITPMTPINPTPVTSFSAIPVIGGILSAFQRGISPSPVSPGVVDRAQGQGPSYSQFLSQQTDASIAATDNAGAIGGGYDPNLAPPSFVVPQTAIDTSLIFPPPDGVMPPGISVDNSNYSGTGDCLLYTSPSPRD